MDNNELLFDEATHQYSKGGVPYISVTQLISRYGLSADYANIPDAILAQAAARGKLTHKNLEDYIKGNTALINTCPEVAMFASYIVNSNINLGVAKSEEQVWDDVHHVAGTIDFQYFDTDGSIVIADFKTTSQLHIDAVAWQLSIYNYLVSGGDLMTYYFNKLKVFHFDGKKMVVKDIYTIEYDSVKAILEAALNNLPSFTYSKPNVLVPATDEKVLVQMLTELEQTEGIVKRIKSEIELVADRLKDNFIRQKQYSYSSPDLRVTYVAPSEKNTIDTAKVKKYLTLKGEDINNYMKTTHVADSLRISKPKQKDQGDTDGDV